MSRTKPGYTPQLGKAKYELYVQTYKRIERARKAGFHIEAIALTESLICDRLESLRTALTRNESQVSTIGRLLRDIAPYNVLSSELIEDLRTWNAMRGLSIHQIPKITSTEDVSWVKRIAYTREVAAQGLLVLKKLRRESDKVIRDSRV